MFSQIFFLTAMCSRIDGTICIESCINAQIQIEMIQIEIDRGRKKQREPVKIPKEQMTP